MLYHFVVSTAEDLVCSQVSYEISRVFDKKITKLSRTVKTSLEQFLVAPV